MNILAYVHLRNILGSTGAGRVARQMTEGLAKLDAVNLRILADADDHRRVVAATGDPWTRFRYHFFESSTSRQQARWFLSGRPRAESYWNEAQIVYCTAESYVPAKRARLVVTMHDAAHFEEGAHRRNPAQMKQQLKWKLLFRRLSRKADMFHTVSQFSADRLAHYFPEMRTRLRVVHNAVTDRFFAPPNPDANEWLASVGLLNRRYILVPGGLHHRKNADLILKAWPQLSRQNPDLLLAMVNHCDPVYAAKVKYLGERVRLLGFVADDDLCAAYSAATAVWFPSKYEGFGMPVLEAMACGAPVVASDSSSLPEVCGGAALLPGVEDADEHVEALQWLLNDEAARASFIEKGRAHARQFRWSLAARRLSAEFQSLV